MCCTYGLGEGRIPTGLVGVALMTALLIALDCPFQQVRLLVLNDKSAGSPAYVTSVCTASLILLFCYSFLFEF